MEPRIADKPSFRVAGKSRRISMKDGENFRVIPQFWRETVEDGAHSRLVALAATGRVCPNRLLGVCSDFAADMSEFTYMIAAEAEAGADTSGLDEKGVPALTWAAFEAVGPPPEAIKKVMETIWSQWFPSSGYGPADGPSLEVYPGGDPMKADYRFEVWTPIKKKA